MSNKVLERARLFLSQKPPPDPPAPGTFGERINTNLLPKTEGLSLLEANQRLTETFPNLVFEDHDLSRVAGWLRAQEHVSLDIETYGAGQRKEERSKKALSFVKGTIRLIQLSAGGETFTLDCAFLSRDAVAGILGALEGKSLYLHNAIFDLPRLLRTFGVDLLEEDVRDTMVLSRLLRAGQWERVLGEDGRVATVVKRHNIKDVLKREIAVSIAKETDHRWEKPLTEERLLYATEDVEHLERLYHDLLDLAEEEDLGPAYNLLRKVYPTYMRQQARGVPFDAARYEEMRGRLLKKLEILDTQLREHAPEHPNDHPDEEGRWVWRNNRKPEEVEGRNGALRALALAGTPLPNLRKPTRLSYLKKHESALFLEALDQYLKHADLESDTRDWLDLYYEDGRLYPNVRFFSQVTGRSAYSGPALQNITKELDLPGMEKSSFRDCVRAPVGSSIVKADYSAQELRILAYVTGDEKLLAAFAAQAAGGKDPHLVVGEKIAGKELVKDTPEGDRFRAAGKRANYGFSYGAGWRTYQSSIYDDTAEVISDKQAKQEKRAFEDAWPGVRRWQQKFGDRGGHEPDAWFTTSFLSRKRWVSRSRDGAPTYTDRLNGPIQAGGADQLYLALGRLRDDPLPGVHVIITTHDEVVLEAPVAVAETALVWLISHMREAIRATIGEELATEDCVEGETSSSWGVVDYPYVWAWTQKARPALGDRKGQRCRVLIWGGMNSALVEFEDGHKVNTSRNALRRDPGDHGLLGSVVD
jgi:DNA polymerase I-like protein with 3'-5' exonuclease and polymerase domains